MPDPKGFRSSPLLVASGFVLIGLCGVATIRHQDILAGGLAVLGLGAMALGVLSPRLSGPVEMSLSGFKVDLLRGVSDVGDNPRYTKEDILAVIREALADQPPPTAAVAAAEPELEELREDATAEAVEQAQLAQALLKRWEATGSLYDLEEATQHAEQAVALTPPDAPLIGPVLLLRARASVDRYQVTGEDSNLDHGIDLAQQALDMVPPDSYQENQALQLLAEALQARYDRTGQLADQDSAITALRSLERARERRR